VNESNDGYVVSDSLLDVALNLQTSGMPMATAERDDGKAAETPILVIQPRQGWGFDLGELWRYRELFGFLVWRDIKIRYAQTVLGAGWALLQPLLTMLVFTVIFGNLANIPSDDVPYPVFSLAGLVLWTYFAAAVSSSSSSLVSSSALITKIYFPRLVIPLSPVLSGIVDFAIAFVLLLAALVYYGLAPAVVSILAVPVSLLIVLMTAAGTGCWLSALNLRYRDVRYIVPFLIQVWMYSSPIVYPMSIIPERLHVLYALNPMAGAIEGFRAALLGSAPVPWSVVGISSSVALILFVSGAVYFRRTERFFADVV
jgi:lipopolysaccharide transport system permease protein